MSVKQQSVQDAGSLHLPVEPLTVRISMATHLTGIGRSRLYELIGEGSLETVKVGRSTLIVFASLKRLALGAE